MTARGWQTGDVAMVNGDVCVYTDTGQWGHGRDDRFPYTSNADARPLVVLDPESKADHMALAKAYLAANPNRGRGAFVALVADRMMNALRELANPTPVKPEEPTGLGAVVEAGGQRYVRVRARGITARHWRNVALDEMKTEHRWDDLPTPVRILSPGWSE